MALFLSACCLVSAATIASVAPKFSRHLAALEIVSGVLLLVGLSITGWYLKIAL